MNIEEITAVVLTANEEENIGRCLERLGWLRRVVVVDSESTDRTPDICRSYANTEFHIHPFESIAGQTNHGLSLVKTEWALVLDADYILSEGFVEAVEKFEPEDAVAAIAPFNYAVFGQKLRASLYPRRIVLHRTEGILWHQDGHAPRPRVSGRVKLLDARVTHDDRKPIGRWFRSQINYAAQEADKLSKTPWQELGLPDKLRKLVLPAAPLTLFWCLLVKGCLLDGWPGLYYTAQRVTAEIMLSVCLLDNIVRPASH